MHIFYTQAYPGFWTHLQSNENNVFPLSTICLPNVFHYEYCKCLSVCEKPAQNFKWILEILPDLNPANSKHRFWPDTHIELSSNQNIHF